MKLNRVYLRSLEVEDHLKTYSWRQDPVYVKNVTSFHRFVNIDTEKKWMESIIEKHVKGEEIRLAVVERNTDEFIGMVSLINIDHVNKNAAFQWMIGPAEKRGRGFAFEAAAKIIHYGFSQLGLIRIWGQILDDNDNVLGFNKRFPNIIQKEGVLRKAIFKNGEYRNLTIIAILKEDFYTQIHNFLDLD